MRGIDGAADVKVEQVAGCRSWRSGSTRREIARRGLSLAAVQDVIGTAIGGREAGAGLRRRPPLPDRGPACRRGCARDIEILKNLPVSLPGEAGASRADYPAARRWRRFDFTEGPNQISRENGKRRVVVTANVRGRDIGSVVREAQAKIAARGAACRRATGSPGAGSSRTSQRRAQRLMIVVPGLLLR